MATTSTLSMSTTVYHLGEKRFVGISPDGGRVVIDAGPEPRAGLGPMQLVLNALPACAAVDVVEMLGKRRLEVRGYRIETSGERRDTSPRSFVRIHSRHVLDVPGLDDKTARRFVELASTKYCSVAASLNAEMTFEVTLEHTAEEPTGRTPQKVDDDAGTVTAG
jgi:putative redox protein